MSANAQQPRAYDVTIVGDSMTVFISKQFDFGNLHQDWAHQLTVTNPGPFAVVAVDLSVCGLVSSTFFAGLVQMHHVYTSKGQNTMRLIKPDPRMVRNMKMLRLDKLFEIIPRE